MVTAAQHQTSRQELKRFTEKFGQENGVAWFQAGLSYSQATSRYISELEERNRQQLAAFNGFTADMSPEEKKRALRGEFDNGSSLAGGERLSRFIRIR